MCGASLSTDDGQALLRVRKPTDMVPRSSSRGVASAGLNTFCAALTLSLSSADPLYAWASCRREGQPIFSLSSSRGYLQICTCWVCVWSGDPWEVV